MPPAPTSYGTSSATICLDFYCEIPCTPYEFLLGQRAISKAQLAREGKNVRVVKHLRESLERSTKELFIDVTAKLPSFARAVLPQFVLYMENQVRYPQNTASLVAVKPRALRGASAFSETYYCEVGEKPVFTIQPPANIALPFESKKVDFVKHWSAAPKSFDSEMVHGLVYKRFMLDVGVDNMLFRRIRAFMVSKFQDAFIDMVREVVTCVLSWTEDSQRRPRFESSAQPGDLASPSRLWPTNGESLQEKSIALVEQFAKLGVQTAEESDVPRQRAASSFLYPAE
jgi:hypothetical protein